MYGVSGFPTLKFFPKNNKAGEDYDGGRDVDDFVNFINEKSGTSRDAQGQLTSKAGTIASLDSLVKEFVAASNEEKKAAFSKLEEEVVKLTGCDIKFIVAPQVQDPDLTGVSHLLVDEIHERGMNEEFLLIILHDLLPRRPDLRLILMSATINANLFSKYFGNAPTIHIPGLTFPVAELFLEDVLEKIRYNIKSESGNSQGNSRGRRQQDSKKDPLTELCYTSYVFGNCDAILFDNFSKREIVAVYPMCAQNDAY